MTGGAKAVGLCLIAFCLSCRSGEEPGGQPTAAVAGRVLVGSCPVAGPAAPPCDAAPVGGVRLVVYDSSGDEVTVGQSNDDGTFRIALSPGSYVLVPEDVPPPALDIEKPIEFRVAPDATTHLRVTLDSGVR